MISRILNSQSKTVTFSALILLGASLVSGVLGLLRNRMLVQAFGAGEVFDAYLAAFRVPDLLSGILIFGGVSAAFLPIFATLAQKEKEQVWEFVSNVLYVLVGVLSALSLVLIMVAPFFIHWIAPGFSTEQALLAVSLTRIMLVAPVLFGASSILSSVLQYFDRFMAYALAPIFYNMGIIAGIVFLAPLWGIWGVAAGVVAGALLHLGVQVPSAIASGFRLKRIFRPRDPSVLRLLALALPRIPSAAAFHINLVVMTALASFLSAGSITIFTLANDIQYIPVGLIGVPFALAVFPALSRAAAQLNGKDFINSFSLTLRQIIFFVVPIAILLFLLRAQTVRVLYGAGTFGWEETRLTAAILGIFSMGVVFYALVPFLARTFFSLQNTVIPMTVSLVSMGLNIILAFLFMGILEGGVFREILASFLRLGHIQDIRVLALPLAMVCSGALHAVLLGVMLWPRFREFPSKEVFSSLGKIAVSSLVMGGVVYLTLLFMGTAVFELRTFWEVFSQLTVAGVAGVLAYIFSSLILRSPELFSLKTAFQKQLEQ
ncbi:MAG: murein biosynthesis integral membrane protein MurJ [bacterium]|nr:murein biosynthesis integral membrane protein MurJ [bacterium]